MSGCAPAPPGFVGLVSDDAFWDYFNRRGGLKTFGYPTSRTFPFLGFTSQFFQRAVLQRAPDGSVRPLNLLDPGLLAYTSFNGATVPPPELKPPDL